MIPPSQRIVLHYVGYDEDGGGILAVVRALAETRQFRCVLGVNSGFRQTGKPPLALWRGPRMAGERISVGNVLRAFFVACRVRRWLRRSRQHVFHGHSRAGLLVGLWLAVLGLPRVIVSVHCYGRQRWFYRFAHRVLGTRLFWLSPAMRTYYGVAGANWEQCIPGGTRRSAAVTQKSPSGRLRLGGVGSIVRWKRWDLPLRALAELPPAVRGNVSFDLVGAPLADPDARAFESELRKLARDLGLESAVCFRGREPSSAALLSESHALVVASEHEPFSIALLEALAAGVPVIAADSGGNADVIRPGKNGWLFRSGDAHALAAVIQEVLQNEAWRAMDPARIQATAVYADDVARRWAEVYARAEA